MKLEHNSIAHSSGHSGENYGGCTSSESNSTPRSVRLHLCPEPRCNGRFHRKFTLREHMKTHTGEKPFQCKVKSCGRRFSTSGNMSRHRRLHLSKQFQCPEEGCMRVYSKREKLALHYRVHMGSNAYPCEVPGCSKTFSTSGNLTRHARKHHQIPATAKSSSTNYHQFSGSDSGADANSEPTSWYGSGGVHSWEAPPTFTRLLSEAPAEQELLELLQCLFERELPAMSSSFVETGVSFSV